MNLSTRDLQAFLALADLRNFGRAAERCHLSPSAFSTRIASIEAMLGARLFDRTTRSVELTQAGVVFLDSARRLYSSFAEVVADFKDHANRRKGRVAIAALPSIASAWLPAVLAGFHARNPGIKLTLHDTLSDHCVELLRHGSVDLAVASHPFDGEDVETQPLIEDGYCLVCAAGHPLARRRSLVPRDLLAYPFIHLPSDSSALRHLERALHPEQIEPAMQLNHLASVAGMVQAGLGITVVPELTLFHFMRPGLVIRRLAIPGLARSIYLVRRRGKSLSFAAEALYDHMLSERRKIPDYLRRQLRGRWAAVRSAGPDPDIPPAARRPRHPIPGTRHDP